MKVLALDTSSKMCSVSLIENDKLILEKTNNDEKTHSQKLMPLIDELLQETNTSLAQIGLIACCVGPGSFTGVRIGVATAKAFVDVKKMDCMGITSLEGLAFGTNKQGYVCSIIDAKNDNVYYSLIEFKDDKYNIIFMESNNIYDVLKKIKDYKSIVFVGDGAIKHKEKIIENIEDPYFSENNIQSSVTIGKIALKRYTEGERKGSNSLNPIYLKKSQAERARDGEK